MTGDLPGEKAHMSQKDKKSKPPSAKKFAELEEKLEASLDYVNSLERTVSQLEAEVDECEERAANN